ncbi:MAG: DeoR/GlpR family DNA-binding transcription regulator [Anaerolineales bacterium]
MTVYNRRKALLELLRKQSDLHMPELAATLSVSEGTVRNDLNALEAEGQLIRVHGGAVLNGHIHFLDTKYPARFQDNVEAKKIIGRRAVELVSDGDSILLDASSTIYYFAQTLQERRQLRIVTNGIDVARLLAREPTNTVILLGGVINLEGSSITGLFNEQIIQELHIQKAFVSCSGFTIEHGMTEVHLAEAQIKRKAIESANQVIALIDSSKFGKEDLTSFARPEQISCLYTDTGLSPEWNARLHKAGIPIILCGEGEFSTPTS